VLVSLVFQEHSTQWQQCQSVWCFKNIVISFLYIVRCPAHMDSNVRQSGVSRTSSSVLYIVRCPVCTGTAVSVSLVFQEHRQQFSVYSPVSSTHGQHCPTVWCYKNIVSSAVYSPVSSTQWQQCPTVWCFSDIVSSSAYSPVSRVHRDSSVSQSGVSTTSSAVFCL